MLSYFWLRVLFKPPFCFPVSCPQLHLSLSSPQLLVFFDYPLSSSLVTRSPFSCSSPHPPLCFCLLLAVLFLFCFSVNRFWSAVLLCSSLWSFTMVLWAHSSIKRSPQLVVVLLYCCCIKSFKDNFTLFAFG